MEEGGEIRTRIELKQSKEQSISIEYDARLCQIIWFGSTVTMDTAEASGGGRVADMILELRRLRMDGLLRIGMKHRDEDYGGMRKDLTWHSMAFGCKEIFVRRRQIPCLRRGRGHCLPSHVVVAVAVTAPAQTDVKRDREADLAIHTCHGG